MPHEKRQKFRHMAPLFADNFIGIRRIRAENRNNNIYIE